MTFKTTGLELSIFLNLLLQFWDTILSSQMMTKVWDILHIPTSSPSLSLQHSYKTILVISIVNIYSIMTAQMASTREPKLTLYSYQISYSVLHFYSSYSFPPFLPTCLILYTSLIFPNVPVKSTSILSIMFPIISNKSYASDSQSRAFLPRSSV